MRPRRIDFIYFIIYIHSNQSFYWTSCKINSFSHFCKVFLDSFSPNGLPYIYPHRVYDVYEVKDMENIENTQNCSACHSCCNRQKHTPRSEEQLKALTSRLNRAIGQLGGIRGMLEDNRYCGDVLIQLSAVQSALQSLGYEILAEHMKTCVVENIEDGNAQIMDEAIDLIKKLK